MQDGKIIGLFESRDESAIAALKETYGKYMFKIAYNILGDIHDSEEALDDAMLKVWNAIPPNRPADLRSWLAKLTRRGAIDILRKRSGGKRGNPGLDVPLDEFFTAVSDFGNPEEELDLKELGEALNSWLGTLSEERRSIFVMRYFYSDSIAEIARCVRRSEANVKTLLCRLRGNLKDYLVKRSLF